MVEGREDFGFALEPRQAIRIASHRGWQDLDRDLAAEARIGGAVDGAHATFTDLCGDLIDAESRAGSQAQMCRDYTGGTAVSDG